MCDNVAQNQIDDLGNEHQEHQGDLSRMVDGFSADALIVMLCCSFVRCYDWRKLAKWIHGILLY